MHITLRKPRTVLTAGLAAAAVAASTLALGAQPAQALRSQAGCGSYAYAWNYWTNEFSQEFIRSDGEYTAYLGYAASQANDARDLWNTNNCN